MQECMFLAMVSDTIRKQRQCASVDISILTFVEKIHSMHRHLNGDISALLKGGNVPYWKGWSVESELEMGSTKYSCWIRKGHFSSQVSFGGRNSDWLWPEIFGVGTPDKSRFAARIQIGPGIQPVSSTKGTGVKRLGRDVDHPPHLVPRLKKG